MINLEEQILREAISMLNASLQELSLINVNDLLSSSDTNHQDKRQEVILSLQKYSLFCSYRYSRLQPRIRLESNFIINGETHRLKICSKNACSLAPIWHKTYFYCRGHLLEGTFSHTDHSIPSRDYALFAYPWTNLYSVSNLNLLSGIEVIAKNNLDFDKESFVELFGFALLKDSGKTIKKHISIDELKEILNDGRLERYCQEEGLEYIAYKLINRDIKHNGFSSRI